MYTYAVSGILGSSHVAAAGFTQRPVALAGYYGFGNLRRKTANFELCTIVKCWFSMLFFYCVLAEPTCLITEAFQAMI
jgi:hypothetical protein